MNYTKASCGHPVVAVGAPGSEARKAVESVPCEECRQRDAAEAARNAAYLLQMAYSA